MTYDGLYQQYYAVLLQRVRDAWSVCMQTGYLSDATDAMLQAYLDADAAAVTYHRQYIA